MFHTNITHITSKYGISIHSASVIKEGNQVKQNQYLTHRHSALYQTGKYGSYSESLPGLK